MPGDLFLDNVTTKAVTVIFPTLSHVLALGRPQGEKPQTTMTDEENKRSETTVVSSTVLPRRKILKTPIRIALKNIKVRRQTYTYIRILCLFRGEGDRGFQNS
jgi:hypothetical protein